MASASFRGSLPVPNVQALAQTCSGPDDKIPDRYIRPEATADEVIGGCDIAAAIPVIDLSKLLDQRSSREECAKMGSACQEWGFFQLINHGVPDEVIGDMKKDIAEFFKLPVEAKEAYSQSQVAGNLQGYGQAFVFSDHQKLDWSDMLYLMLQPIESRDMRFWPAHPPSFRNSVERYSCETAKVARCLLKFLAMDMGVEPESFLEMFRGQHHNMKMTYYPPCRQAEEVIGISSHTDAVVLTLLLQVNDVQGLQIKKDGRWLAVDALDGAFIVNVGDILEIVSNGRYKSIEHRAMVQADKERISAAMFYQPSPDTTVGPLPELVKNRGEEARYRSMGHVDFMKRFFSIKLDGRSNLDGLRI